MNTHLNQDQMLQRSVDSNGNNLPGVEQINGKYVFNWSGSMTGSQSKIEVLEEFAKANPGTQVTVIFNSTGGGVDDCRESYNRMLLLRTFYQMHFTFVVVAAKSCAFWFIQCADVRIGLPHTALMYHCVKWSLNEAKSQKELADAQKSMARNQKEFTEILCSRCPDPAKVVEETLALIDDGNDHLFSAEDAVAKGWLDQVYKPVFQKVEAPVDLTGIPLES